jgi:hypothetical protein
MTQKNEGGSEIAFFLIVLIGLGAVGFMIYSNFHVVATGWKYLRMLLLLPFAIIPDWFPIVGELKFFKALRFLYYTDGADLVSKTVIRFDAHYLKWISWVPGLFLMAWGVKRIRSASNNKSSLDMEGLLHRVAPLYPHLEEFLERNPENEPLVYKQDEKATHKTAMPVSPAIFARLDPPMGLSSVAKKNNHYARPIWDGNKDFDSDLAERSFVAQMGNRYQGVFLLSDTERKVFDSLMERLAVPANIKIKRFKEASGEAFKHFDDSKISSENKDSDKPKTGIEKLAIKIQQIAASDRSKNKEFSVAKFMEIGNIKKIIKTHRRQLDPLFKLIRAEDVMSLHAFTISGLMSLMEEARKSGVVTSIGFNWVKREDRVLWTALCSIGRRVSFVECAGPFAHRLLEQQIGRPVSEPEVFEAVQGLRLALGIESS